MTVKKQTKCGGLAAVIARQRLQNTNQQLDPATISKQTSHNFNISVGFNEKDNLQLTTKDENKDDEKKLKDYNTKIETIKIDEIVNCVNVENQPNGTNTLVFYVTRNTGQEAIAVKFENEQDFKRIYFTYKYFKMRNRLTKNNTNYTSSENLYSKKKYSDTSKVRKNSIDSYDKTKEFDLHQTTDNNGVTHISVQQRNANSRFDQPMSLIGIRTEDLGEIDSVIYTDDIPVKPDRKKLFQKLKAKAPLPPTNKENQKILKGQFVRVNVDKVPDVVPKDSKPSKIPDILVMRDKPRNRTTNNNVWSTNNKGVTGYDSDREEWRSRSQFSTSAFDSLARPTKMAMAFSLRKPLPRAEVQVPQYYRIADPKTNLFRPPNNFIQRPPRLPRPPEIKKNQLNNDHRKFTSLQNLEVKRINDIKKVNDKKISNISTKISGLTNKLKDLGSHNTLGRFRAQSQNDVANLKPVIKKTNVDGSKRPVVRTCSAEPPKKVTFSAFATVQVV